MKYIATIILGIVILGLTHSRIADIVGMLVIAFGVYKLYVSENGTWGAKSNETTL